MKKTIEKLYELHTKEHALPFGKPDKVRLNEECLLYDNLYEELEGELKKQFIRYLSVLQERHSQELRAVYEYGFKDAIQLWEQSLRE